MKLYAGITCVAPNFTQPRPIKQHMKQVQKAEVWFKLTLASIQVMLRAIFVTDTNYKSWNQTEMDNGRRNC
jgi:hypothetical protein